MEKLYYTISETAEILGESTSLVRFWSNSFPKYIKPYRNAKGNRMFTAEDIETLKQTNAELISTLDDVLRIQEEGRTKRSEAEAEMARMEAELKQKLLELSKTSR